MKRVGEAEPLGQPGEDRVVVARLAIGRRRPGASRPAAGRRPSAPISSRSSVIVAGSTISAWRAVAVHARFVHDDRVRAGRRRRRSRSEILMMMERVAAGPIDQPDIGIGAGAGRCSRTRSPGCSSMSAMRATGMKSAMLLRPIGKVGSGTASGGLPVFEIDAQRIGEAAARQADLAEHRRQHERPSRPAARHARRAAATSSR